MDGLVELGPNEDYCFVWQRMHHGWMDVGKGMRGHFVTMSNSDVIFVYINWFVIRLIVR